ncbi:DNA-binding transcriptional regulator YhcF (GntR family) [Bacillus fengqiuensis]|nr:DNA-binding transcriptional regulator YhcF (GntR family) [Bacillus fengqiuensis]
MKTYSNKDMAVMTGLAGSTIRNYVQLLEKSGYTFTENEFGHKVFHDNHIVLFRVMKELSDAGAVSPERIADIVVMKEREYEKTPEKERTAISNSANLLIEKEKPDNAVQCDEWYGILMKKLEKLEKLDRIDDLIKENQELKEEIKKLREHMEQRDERVLEAIRSIPNLSSL